MFPICWPLSAGICSFWLQTGIPCIKVLPGDSFWRHTPHAYDKKAPIFAQGRDFFMLWARFWDPRHSQVAIYTVIHEESESEVEKCQICEPGGKMQEKPTLGIPGSRCLKVPGGYIYSFSRGIRIWGWKMLILRARRENIRKTHPGNSRVWIS